MILCHFHVSTYLTFQILKKTFQKRQVLNLLNQGHFCINKNIGFSAIELVKIRCVYFFDFCFCHAK